MLNDLTRVIETIQNRIREHGQSLQQNETRTRMALIDPLLQALGWDISDPAFVIPEYPVGSYKADYALLKPNGHPAATVEAKKLGEGLESHRMQMLNYSNASGVDYAGITDGNRWELYDVFKRGQLEDRRVLDITIADTPTHRCALELLLLWRPNLASGEPVAANEQILSTLIAPPTPVAPAIDVQPPATYPLAPPSKEGWISLNGFQPGRNRPPPSTVRFPDGDERPTQYWVNVLMEVAEWLVRTGKLTSDKYPVAFPLRRGRTRHMINDQPLHSDGTAFVNPRTLSNDLMIELNVSANGAVRNSQFLLQNFGEDAAAVWLKFN